jgi:hypothetical protein
MPKDKEFAELTFENLAGGALPERLQDALAKVIANYRDINTDADAARKITIEITFVGSEPRTQFATRANVKYSLAALKAVEDQVFLGRDENGRTALFTFDPTQLDALHQSEQATVHPISTAQGAR